LPAHRYTSYWNGTGNTCKYYEKRAREMHRVILSSDAEQWKKFIRENYTQALIDKPTRFSVQTSDNGDTNTSSSELKADDKIEAKAKVFSQLHEDFGDSNISSLKTAENKSIMVLRSTSGFSGTFTITFEKAKPYRIDALSIEAGN
jgi:hypothetical protein